MAQRKAKPESQGKPSGGGGPAKPAGSASKIPLAVAVLLPLLLVGGYLLVHGNARIAGYAEQAVQRVVDVCREGAGRVVDFFSRPEKGPVVVSRTGKEEPAARQAPAKKATARTGERKRNPRPATGKEAPARQEIPRQVAAQSKPASVALTVRQAQNLATMIFSGRVAGSRSSPRSPWYSFELVRGRKHYPYDVRPVNVSIGTTALAGAFSKGSSGLVVLVKVEDPSGPEWSSTYVGATLISGTAGDPKKTLGSTAMQSPGGSVTRSEAVDIEGDGVLELALEVESEGPGGYLFRDFALHAFGGGGTTVKWSARTLEDGPGVPLETADFKNVGFEDRDGDGRKEIVVEEGKREFRIEDDFSRTLTKERILTTRTYRLLQGRFRVAMN
jgi:hypothetical protein